MPDTDNPFRGASTKATPPCVNAMTPMGSYVEHNHNNIGNATDGHNNTPGRAGSITHVSKQRSRPSSSFKNTTPAKSQAPRPASAAGVPGFISVPGELYATPPAVVARAYGGFQEGQLQYQFGKVAPLMPTYSACWLREPPQRASVIDLRLQPSSRALSCYSPEFVAEAASCPPSSAVLPSSRPATAPYPTTTTTSRPKQKHRPLSSPTHPQATQGRSASASTSPSRYHRQSLRSMDSGVSAVAAAAAATVRGEVPFEALRALQRSHTGRWGSQTLASFHTYNRGQVRGQVGVGPELGTRAGGPGAAPPAPGRTPHNYFGGIKKGLARSPMTETIRAQAVSPIQRQLQQRGTAAAQAWAGDTARPTSATTRRASAVLDLSRQQSRVISEAGALLTCPPPRTTHHPTPTERARHQCSALSHDSSPRLKYRDRLTQWGV